MGIAETLLRTAVGTAGAKINSVIYRTKNFEQKDTDYLVRTPKQLAQMARDQLEYEAKNIGETIFKKALAIGSNFLVEKGSKVLSPVTNFEDKITSIPSKLFNKKSKIVNDNNIIVGSEEIQNQTLDYTAYLDNKRQNDNTYNPYPQSSRNTSSKRTFFVKKTPDFIQSKSLISFIDKIKQRDDRFLIQHLHYFSVCIEFEDDKKYNNTNNKFEKAKRIFDENTIPLLCTSIGIPNIEADGAASHATPYGNVISSSSRTFLDTTSIRVGFLNTQTSIQDLLFLEWMKQLSNSSYSYDNIPYRRATIHVEAYDQTMTNLMTTLSFHGCVPIRVDMNSHDMNPKTVNERIVTFLFENVSFKPSEKYYSSSNSYNVIK